LQQELQVAYAASDNRRDCFVTLATGVLGAHVGSGAWGVFYQVEDP
jgi:fatty acid-binding protein DegV